MKRLRLLAFSFVILAAPALGTCSLFGLDHFVIPGCTSNADCEPLNTRDGIDMDQCMRFQCVHRSNANVCRVTLRDNDEDGDPDIACMGGHDCDDHDKDSYAVGNQGDGGTAGPHPEVCDGKDNNCNGVIDDNPPDRRIDSQVAVPLALNRVERVGISQVSGGSAIATYGASTIVDTSDYVAYVTPIAGRAATYNTAAHQLLFASVASMADDSAANPAQGCTRRDGSAVRCDMREAAIDGAATQFVAGVTSSLGCEQGALYVGYRRPGDAADLAVIRNFGNLSNVFYGIDTNPNDACDRCSGFTAGAIGATRPTIAAMPSGTNETPQALLTYLAAPAAVTLTRSACSSGVCAPVCPGGATNCTGSCVDLMSSDAHCGACGTVCGGGTRCVAGVCSCPTGQGLCRGTCTNTNADPTNCGACGTACSAGRVCSAGACTASCAGGTTSCSSACVNTSTDNANCGTCGNACGGGMTCGGGTCSCPSGSTNCSGTCANTATDNNHCGTCGTVCGAGTHCAAGACVAICAAGTTNCSGSCVDTNSDASNCGTCGHSCGGNTVVYDECTSPPADVRALGVFLMDVPGNTSRHWITATGNGTGVRLGTSGGGGASIAMLPTRGYFVAYGNETGSITLQFIPQVTPPVLTLTSPDVMSTDASVDAAMDAPSVDGVGCNPAAPAPTNGYTLSPSALPTPVQGTIPAVGARRVAIDIIAPDPSVVSLGVTWVQGCGLATSSVWSSIVTWNGDAQTFSASRPIQISPDGASADEPSIVGVDHGFVRPLFTRNGIAAPDGRHGGLGGFYIAYIDRSLAAQRVLVRRVAQFDGGLIVESAIDLTDPAVRAQIAGLRLYQLGTSPEPVSFAYGSISAAGLVGGSIVCPAPP